MNNYKKTLFTIVISTIIFFFFLIILGEKVNYPLLLSLTIGLFFAILFLIKPKYCLFVFIFLIPFEDITIISQSLTLIKIIGWLLLFIWLFTKIRNKKFPQIDKTSFLLILFFVWASLSFFWAYNPTVVLNRIPTFIQLLILYVILTDMVKDRKTLHSVLWIYTFGTILASLLTIFFFFSGEELIGTRAAISSSGSPNHLPLSMIPAFMWLWINFSTSKVWKSKLINLILLLPIIGVIILSASRGALLALFLTLMISLIWKNQRKQTFYLFFIGIMGYIFLNLINNPDIFSRFTVERFLYDRGAGRFDIWLVGLKMAKENFFIGVGLDNYPWVFGDYYAITQTLRSISYFKASHNIYLGVLVELGIVGIILFLGFIIIKLLSIFNNIKPQLISIINKNNNISIPLTVLLSLVSLLIGGFFLDILYRKYFWIFLSLCTACNLINISNENSSEINKKIT